MRFAELDAVTVDANGTLVSLADPVPALKAALRSHGLERTDDEVRAAFRAEVAHYRPRSLRGRDEASLNELRSECVGVFLAALGADLDPCEFVPSFLGSLRFEPLPGTAEALAALRARGLELAVVANWDASLRDVLAGLGLDRHFAAIVSSAEAGLAKPDPGIFRLALGRIGVEPARALHIGDEPDDEQGALAAGMRFLHAPLASAFEGWT